MEKIFIASDHAGVNEKQILIDFLSEDFEVVDLGANSSDSVHYPDYGHKLAKEVLNSGLRGVALCGSGIGISIALNRHKGIRAALCRSKDDAKMSRLHNNSNVICFGARVSSVEDIKSMLTTWIETEFEGGSHQTRTEMFANLGSEVE